MNEAQNGIAPRKEVNVAGSRTGCRTAQMETDYSTIMKITAPRTSLVPRNRSRRPIAVNSVPRAMDTATCVTTPTMTAIGSTGCPGAPSPTVVAMAVGMAQMVVVTAPPIIATATNTVPAIKPGSSHRGPVAVRWGRCPCWVGCGGAVDGHLSRVRG